jgi:hypothetical protein
MNRRSSPFRHLAGWRHQVALAVLFALQGAIALSPLLESNERGRMPVHVEQQGATHRYQHNEATCAVCTVRALHSSPAQACPAIACERQQAVAALDAPVAPLHGVDTTALPRAPPQLR